uniref:Uncharacterized protein n=1 Tax=Cucumis sativus TaxID=3659 RepID=A0A0A0L7V6_CUCSA
MVKRLVLKFNSTNSQFSLKNNSFPGPEELRTTLSATPLLNTLQLNPINAHRIFCLRASVFQSLATELLISALSNLSFLVIQQ